MTRYYIPTGWWVGAWWICHDPLVHTYRVVVGWWIWLWLWAYIFLLIVKKVYIFY